MAQIIDGKAVSAAVKAEVAEEAAKLKEEKGLKIGLAVVIVGNNPAIAEIFNCHQHFISHVHSH